MQDYRKIRVWQRSHALVLRVYELTRNFPKDELFGLASQARRAAVSVPANIAEGAGRGGKREFGRYLNVSFGSASELEYYLLLAYDLSLLPATDYATLSAELGQVKRMLAGLSRTVRSGGSVEPGTDKPRTDN